MIESDAGIDASPGAPRHFEPSWQHYHRRLLRRMLWFGPLLLLALLFASPSFGFAFIGLGTVMLLGGMMLSVYFARMRVSVEHGELRIRGPLRTRRWPVHAVATLVFLPLPGSARPNLYGVAPTLERLFVLSAETWKESDLEGIADAVGATVVRAPVGLTVAEITERYPGTIGWTTRRPWLFMLLMTGLLMLFVLVIAVITAAALVASGQVPLPVPTPTAT